MSTYRGFNKSLIRRATQAEGDKYYFNRDTLDYWDARGHETISHGPDHVVMVDSIRDTYDDTPRQYRVIRVSFHTMSDDDITFREHVTVNRLSTNHPSARAAIAEYRAITVMED